MFPIGKPKLLEIAQSPNIRNTIAAHIGRGITKNTKTGSLGVRTANNPPSAKIAPLAPIIDISKPFFVIKDIRIKNSAAKVHQQNIILGIFFCQLIFLQNFQ